MSKQEQFLESMGYVLDQIFCEFSWNAWRVCDGGEHNERMWQEIQVLPQYMLFRCVYHFPSSFIPVHFVGGGVRRGYVL